MPFKTTALFLAVSLIAVSVQAAEPVLSGGVVALSMAKDGSGWAMIRSRPYAIELHKNGRVFKLRLTELDAVTDVTPDPSLEWSWDGRFVMIKYSSEESSSTIEIFATDDPKRVARFPADDAKWLLTGHRLVVVEANTALDTMKAQRGLIVFDPVRNERLRIAEDHVLVGRVDTGVRHALAQSISKHSDQVVITPIVIAIRLADN